ncbi:MAG: MATE family efflux transporter [Butyrivibrio sp.]|nr:MATE family efflux transporter [Butyrivibrio sp.]
MRKLIGTKDFYRHLLLIAIPIMIQNGITNFVGMLNNIMVGRVGTDQMSGVAIVNQLFFVYNLCIFGGISGAGIFAAQFYGKGDHKGVRECFRFKLITVAVLAFLGILTFTVAGPVLIRLYLHEDGSGSNAAATLLYAKQYMTVMLLDMIPFAISQTYTGTLRETDETVLPMKAGITAVLVNLVLNYVLIYGKFGMPAFGVVGAAIATVISRFVEMGIIVIWTHTHTERNHFIEGAYRHFEIPVALMKQMTIKGFPLLANETLWAAGQAVMLQNYSIRGLTVIAAMNISATISNVFNIVFIAMGSAIAILIGQELGAEKKEVREDAGKMTFFAVICCMISGALMLCAAPFFPNIYNTDHEVRSLATSFIMVSACCMPMYAYENATYFTLRSGGKTFITFLFDSCFVWVFSIPLAFVLVHDTRMPITLVFLCCQMIELIKCLIGYLLVKKGIWINNITNA